MNKKNDQKLCWNCDGSIALHLERCPYCGVDVNAPPNPGSPWEAQKVASPPPFGTSPFPQDYTPTQDEWRQTNEAKQKPPEETDEKKESKNEMIALLLLLPGVVFFLFGLALILFSKDGVLTLRWNQSFALFYFLGAVPLLFLGWRALR